MVKLDVAPRLVDDQIKWRLTGGAVAVVDAGDPVEIVVGVGLGAVGQVPNGRAQACVLCADSGELVGHVVAVGLNNPVGQRGRNQIRWPAWKARISSLPLEAARQNTLVNL
jgi:hypothetical protein